MKNATGVLRVLNRELRGVLTSSFHPAKGTNDVHWVEAGWDIEPIWTLGRTEGPLSPAGYQTPVVQPAASNGYIKQEASLWYAGGRGVGWVVLLAARRGSCAVFHSRPLATVLVPS